MKGTYQKYGGIRMNLFHGPEGIQDWRHPEFALFIYMYV